MKRTRMHDAAGVPIYAPRERFKLIALLLWIGLIRRELQYNWEAKRWEKTGKVRLPFSTWSWDWWKLFFFNPGWSRGHDPLLGGWFAVFRNRPGVIKWEEGRLLPRRWGVRIFGLEIGDRG